jgi:hypothetical protein
MLIRQNCVDLPDEPKVRKYPHYSIHIVSNMYQKLIDSSPDHLHLENSLGKTAHPKYGTKIEPQWDKTTKITSY